MKPILFASLSVLSSFAFSQGHGGQMAQQMKLVDFMKGNWHGKQNFNTGGDPMVGEATNDIEPAVGGRYLEETMTTTLPGRTSDTRHLLTFDPKTGMFKAWWFNDTSVGPTELEGTCDGTSLVLKTSANPDSKRPTLRATYHKVSNSQLTFTLEMQVPEGWQKLFTTSYTKS